MSWVAALAVTVLVAAGLTRYMVAMPGRSFAGPLAPLDGAAAARRDRLRAHVEMLGGRIGERSVWRPDALAAAAEYIATTWHDAGYRVGRQAFMAAGREVMNLHVERTGSDPVRVVVIGAHYDSVLGSPGANDNASGVAAILELAAQFRTSAPAVTLRFVAFVNEEPPFFLTWDMGSRRYARHCRDAGERVVAMLSLETIGCYLDLPGSQHYPGPFRLLYPGTGNFVAFVGNLRSRALVRRCVGAFRRATLFPSEGAAPPGYLPGVFWSDHWAFWREGFPAVMVTDTAPFRYRHYHSVDDTPDKLNYDRMTRVVGGLGHVVTELAGAPPSPLAHDTE